MEIRAEPAEEKGREREIEKEKGKEKERERVTSLYDMEIFFWNNNFKIFAKVKQPWKIFSLPSPSQPLIPDFPQGDRKKMKAEIGGIRGKRVCDFSQTRQ